MITIQTKVIPHPEVIFTALSNQESVLLHLQTQQYFTLNETGTRIWKGLTHAPSLAQIGQALEAQYDLTLEQAYQYTVDLVSALAAERLIQVVETA